MQPRLDIFFNLFKACFDGLAFYPKGNPIVNQQMENLLGTCNQFLEGDRLVISLGLHHFAVGGTALPAKVLALPSVTWLIGVFGERHIHTMVLYRGVSIRDMEHLMRLLQLDRSRFSSQTSANELLELQKVWRIQFNMAAVSPEDPFSALDVSGTFAGWSPVADPNIIPSGFMLDLNTPPEPVPNEPQHAPGLFIDPDQQQTLARAMRTEIAAGNLQRVAETLTLIRGDLRAPDREERELAYSSYQVVVDCLLETNQDHSALIVLKSMGNDFHHCRETDLYSLHLTTAFKITCYFEATEQFVGLTYGLNLLANQNLCQEGERRQAVGQYLDRILNLHLFERLFAQSLRELGPVLQALFQRHGLGILKQLLFALYEAQNRNTRKKLLEVLSKLGTLSYPFLLEELRSAIAQIRPWFIKRNLLTLLSISPPADLVELLPDLYREDLPKLRELVVRCLFMIPTPEAFKLGRTMIRESEPNQLLKILRYLQLSRQGAYAFELMEAFKRLESGALREEIILTLGKLATEDSERHLIEILDKAPLTLGKITTQQRLAVIAQLARSNRPQVLEALARQKRDFSKEIREAVQQVLARAGVGS